MAYGGLFRLSTVSSSSIFYTATTTIRIGEGEQQGLLGFHVCVVALYLMQITQLTYTACVATEGVAIVLCYFFHEQV